MIEYHQSWIFITLSTNICGTCVQNWVDQKTNLLDLTFTTSLEPHFQKVLPCRHSCHPWDLEALVFFLSLFFVVLSRLSRTFVLQSRISPRDSAPLESPIALFRAFSAHL